MPTPDTPSPASFPLVAILPDLWTVYRRTQAVSQHATLRLAMAHIDALVGAGAGSMCEYSSAQPEHSQSAIQHARQAIRRAQRKAREQDPRAHWVICGCCGLWHDPNEDCPPPPGRHWSGFDGSVEP